MYDAMTSTQVERKFLWQQEEYSLAKEKELGELDQNVTPLLLFIATLLLNMFCCIFQHSFIKSPYLFRAEEELLYERSVKLGFIFNNYSSFLNSSMHLILCGDGFIYAKLKKSWSLFMQLLISYQLNCYQENYDNNKNREWRRLETFFLQEEFF